MERSKKQVKTMFNESSREKILLILLNELKNGKYPSKIAKEWNISKQTLTPYIFDLKAMGIIRRSGYGIWQIAQEYTEEVKRLPLEKLKDALKVENNSDEIRFHGSMWELRLPKIKNWDKRIKILEEREIKYKLVGRWKNTPSILVNGYKVWLSNESIQIYLNKSFTHYEAQEALRQAFKEVLEIKTELEKKLGILLKINGLYEIKPLKEHYALINNAFAALMLEEGIKFQVRDKKGELWLLVDNSNGNVETETFKRIDIEGMRNYFNSHKETNFKVTPEFVLNGFAELKADREYYAEHIRSHVGAIQSLDKGIQTFNQLIVVLINILGGNFNDPSGK